MIHTMIQVGDTEIRCGVITIFTVDEAGYAALIPLKEDDTPAQTDVMIFGCEIDGEEECSFYELESEKEYAKATEAFLMIADEFKEGTE